MSGSLTDCCVAVYGVRFADLLEKYHSGKLVEWREKSLDFLREALNG